MRIKTQLENQTFACVLIRGSLLSPYWLWSSALPSKSGFGTPSMPADCTDCRLDLQQFLYYRHTWQLTMTGQLML